MNAAQVTILTIAEAEFYVAQADTVALHRVLYAMGFTKVPEFRTLPLEEVKTFNKRMRSQLRKPM